MDRYTKNAFYISSEEQRVIKNTHVLLAGAGLGSNIAECLLRLGFEKLTIVDADTVDLTNLNRQNYVFHDIGNLKTAALKKRLKMINPDAQILDINEFIHERNAEQVINVHDLAVNALDFQSPIPFVFDQLCIKYNIKVLHPYNFGWGSMVAVVTPESKQLCDISTDYRFFETKMASYVFQSGRLPDEFLIEVSPLLKRFLESSTSMTPPQLSVGSWLAAALCTRIAYAASLNKPLKLFPDFYFISTLM